MTDKELRKLSRLELLELLLEASKENKKLKEKVNMLKAENKMTQNIENLSAATRQVENALEYANGLTDVLKTISAEGVLPAKSTPGTVRNAEQPKGDVTSDREIYRRMLYFFAKNDDKLKVFPEDIENDVRGRIKSILEKRNMK